MPSRLIGALAALLLPLTIAVSVASAAASPLPGRDPAAPARFQDDVPVEDEFSAFSMPGLTPDNFTDTVLADIDAFWAGEFATYSTDYYAAGVIPVSEVIDSTCGPFGPYDNPAAFCPLDDTVYVSVPLGQDIMASVGDFAWITVLAHEYGHHVQLLLGIQPALTIDREVQADCFAGAYALRAQKQGYLQEGDITEAMVISILSADPVDLGETVQGAHGSGDYRVTAFMQGYFNGAAGCMDYTSGVQADTAPPVEAAG